MDLVSSQFRCLLCLRKEDRTAAAVLASSLRKYDTWECWRSRSMAIRRALFSASISRNQPIPFLSLGSGNRSLGGPLVFSMIGLQGSRHRNRHGAQNSRRGTRRGDRSSERRNSHHSPAPLTVRSWRHRGHLAQLEGTDVSGEAVHAVVMCDSVAR